MLFTSPRISWIRSSSKPGVGDEVKGGRNEREGGLVGDGVTILLGFVAALIPGGGVHEG